MLTLLFGAPLCLLELGHVADARAAPPGPRGLRLAARRRRGSHGVAGVVAMQQHLEHLRRDELVGAHVVPQELGDDVVAIGGQELAHLRVVRRLDLVHQLGHTDQREPVLMAHRGRQLERYAPATTPSTRHRQLG
eukprot:687878-Prymnesium_polylepis.2